MSHREANDHLRPRPPPECRRLAGSSSSEIIILKTKNILPPNFGYSKVPFAFEGGDDPVADDATA